MGIERKGKNRSTLLVVANSKLAEMVTRRRGSSLHHSDDDVEFWWPAAGGGAFPGRRYERIVMSSESIHRELGVSPQLERHWKEFLTLYPVILLPGGSMIDLDGVY